MQYSFFFFFRQAVSWHGQTLPTCLINRGEKGGPWKQEGNLNLGSLLHLTHNAKGCGQANLSQKKLPGLVLLDQPVQLQTIISVKHKPQLLNNAKKYFLITFLCIKFQVIVNIRQWKSGRHFFLKRCWQVSAVRCVFNYLRLDCVITLSYNDTPSISICDLDLNVTVS